MARPIRLGLLIPDHQDPTSYYRGIGPLAMLQKQMPELQFLFPNPINWATLKLCDLIFMQRPALPDHFNALLMCKQAGIPVWVDFDDDNLSVPKDNPTYPLYSQMPIKDSIVKITRYADVVTVSTEKLRKKYSIYNKNCFVIPNALDDFLLGLRNIPTSPRQHFIMWRGTPTHTKNLKVVQEQVIELAQKYPDWKFGFYGHDPLDITERIRNHQVWAATPIIQFFTDLVNIHATACYYSLADNDHAQSRSHVSWLEATFAGMAFIGPDIPEFQRPGILNYKTPEDFYRVTESVIKGEVDIEKQVNESWAHIQERYMLSRINNMRAQILHQMHARVFGPAPSASSSPGA